MKGAILALLFVGYAQARPQVAWSPLESVTNVCPPTGHYLLPHEYDCTKFYYCEYGVRREYPTDCAPGTEFSFDLQVCVHPAIANCGLSGIPPTTDASETEATTEAATEAPTTTEDNASSEDETEAPTTTEAATEAPTTTAAPETEAPTTTEAATEAPTTTAAPETEAPTTTEAATEAPTTTAAPETEAPTTTEAATEAPNTTAAPETEAPTTTEAATEAPTTTAAPETEAPTTTEAATEAPTTTAAPETEAPTTTEAANEVELLPNGCPADFNIYQLLPHESECSQFYYCNFGEKVLSDCAPGTHFNPTLQVCDWPENAGCANQGNGDNESTTPAATETEAPTDATTTVEPETEAPTTTEAANEVELLPNGCPADFNIHQLLPHESECSQFYYCNFGEKVLRDCAPGTHFNPTLQVCDWPENAGCANSGNGEDGSGEEDSDATTTGAPSSTEASIISTTTSAAPSSTEASIISTTTSEAPSSTEASIISTTTSEAPSSTEASIISTTTSEAPSSTEAAAVTTAAPDNGTLDNGCPSDFNVHQLLPHEEDCSLFYYCNFGEKVLRQCAPGTHFNPTIQVCDWPENAGCANAATTTEGPSSTEASIISTTTSEAPSSTEASIISTTTSEAPSSTEAAAVTTAAPDNGTLDNGCPSDFNVHQLLPHEEDCSLFYYCNFGEKVLRQCAPGTHFNPSLQVCDWPENAGCANAATTTEGPSSTEASIISTSTSEAPSSTEASIISTTTSEAPSSTEASIISTTTSEAPSSTEAAVVTTVAPDNGTLDNGCPSDFSVHKHLPHEEDCSLFYICDFGEKVLSQCAPGTHFNPTIQVCDWPENAGCANAATTTEGPSSTEASIISTTTSEAPSSTEASIISTTTSEAPSSTEAAVVTTAAPDNGTLDNGCPSDFSVHKLLPHEEDCSLFYICDFGEKVLRQCAPGTHFNPTIQVCDWPENAGCANAATTTEGPSSTEASIISTTTSEAPSSTEAAVVTTAAPDNGTLDNGCPSDFNVHQLLPHEEDCSLFYYCNFGEKVLSQCAPGTHFNPTIQVCDWPESAGCANAATTTEGPSSTEASIISTTTSEAPSSTEASIISTTTSEAPSSTEAAVVTTAAPDNGTLDNGCPSDFNVHQLLPHEEDCSLFYYCNFGEKLLTQCAPGTHFNPSLQVCDWPENAGCANAVTTTNAPSSTEAAIITTAAPENATTTTEAPSSTEAAVVTTAAPDNATTTTEAPSSTEASIISTTTSEAPSSTEAAVVTTAAPDNGTLDNGCPSDFSVHRLLPHEEDCSLFYICDFGEKVVRECAAGTHFNPTEQICDWPENAGCANAGGDSEEIENGETGSGEEDIGSGGGNSEEDIGTETDEDQNAKCQESCNVAPWAHDSDCDKYWRCEGGNAVLGICSEGLHYNEETKTCDFICNANCVRDTAQTTVQKDGIKIFLPWDKMDADLLQKYTHL